MKTKSRFILYSVGVLSFVGSLVPASAALVVNPPMAVSEIVTVQPIIVSDAGGGNTANFFGTAGQQSTIEGFIDTIWAQAGIGVNFLTTNSWNDTFANWGSGGPPNNGNNTRPTTDLSTIVSDGSAAGVTNVDPNVINMYFVNISAGFSLLGPNNSAGLSFVDNNGVTQYVGTNLLDFTGGQEVIASVVSHEIGHNLGLGHITELENLMLSGSEGQRLNSAQIATALASPLSVATVPVPPAIALMLSGLLGLFAIFRRKGVQSSSVRKTIFKPQLAS